MFAMSRRRISGVVEPACLIACVVFPRFELVAATGDRRELLARPIALAPALDGPQVIGDASGPAEAFGVAAGMRLAEALARCPALALIPPDPQASEEVWERVLESLEGIGAAVESERPGEAFFGLDGLRGLWGDAERALARAGRIVGPGARLGAGPTRLCALAMAVKRRRRDGGSIVGRRGARAFLSSLPIGTLRNRLGDEWTGIQITDTLERLGVTTLGELAELPVSAVADRFGDPGLRAQRLARGHDPAAAPTSAAGGSARDARTARRGHGRPARAGLGAAPRSPARQTPHAVGAVFAACAWRHGWPAAAAGG